MKNKLETMLKDNSCTLDDMFLWVTSNDLDENIFTREGLIDFISESLKANKNDLHPYIQCLMDNPNCMLFDFNDSATAIKTTHALYEIVLKLID